MKNRKSKLQESYLANNNTVEKEGGSGAVIFWFIIIGLLLAALVGLDISSNGGEVITALGLPQISFSDDQKFMGELAGVGLVLLIVFAFLLVLLIAIMKLVFSGVSAVGSSVAMGVTKRVAGEEYAKEHEKTIRAVGGGIGKVGLVLAGGALIDDLDCEGVEEDSDLIESAATPIEPHAMPDESLLNHGPDTEVDYIESYTKQDGTFVEGHLRTVADETIHNNINMGNIGIVGEPEY